MYIPVNPQFYKGCKGVFVTRTCFREWSEVLLYANVICWFNHAAGHTLHDSVVLGTVVGSMLDPTVQLVVQFTGRGLGRPLVLSGY